MYEFVFGYFVTVEISDAKLFEDYIFIDREN